MIMAWSVGIEAERVMRQAVGNVKTVESITDLQSVQC